LDGAVPRRLVDRLRCAFDDGAPFWNAHAYDAASTGYFSYVLPLDALECHGAVGELAAHVLAALKSAAPRHAFARRAADGAKACEWWVHKKPANAGHELHFDADSSDAAHLPLCSVALVLEDADRRGGPLLVTPYRGDGGGEAFRNCAFASSCVRGRLACFDGALLHGVAPGRPGGAVRTTLMMSFWDALPSVDAEMPPRAAMRTPRLDGAAEGLPAWAETLRSAADSDGGDDEGPPPPLAYQPLALIEPLWVATTATDSVLTAPPPPDFAFQGVTSWRPLVS